MKKSISVLAYADGFTIFHYRPAAGETWLQITEPGFFNGWATDLLAAGDKVIVSNDRLAFEGFIFGDGGARKLFLSSSVVTDGRPYSLSVSRTKE